MGCGLSKVAPSSPESSRNAFFVSAELTDASKILGKDEPVRAAFVQYVKSGVWLERINLSEYTNTSREEVSQRRNSTIFEYSAPSSVDLGQLLTQAALSKAEYMFKTLTISPRASPTGRSSRSTTKHNSIDSRDECYARLEVICGLSEVQLVAIMTGILFPMFLESSEWMALKSRADSGPGQVISSKPDVSGLKTAATRAQELLLSCAARFDEDTLMQYLQDPVWLSTLQSAFHDFPLPISVCDTNRDTCPLVYVNRAFEELVGRPSRKLLGKRLNVLNGPDTELALFERLLEAQRCNLPCKVAITHYAVRGAEWFLDLLAVRPSGGYSFAVHCPANRSTLNEDLKMVDDALMLLAYVVKAPPVRKLQRGQSWVPSIHNLRAMSRRLHI